MKTQWCLFLTFFAISVASQSAIADSPGSANDRWKATPEKFETSGDMLKARQETKKIYGPEAVKDKSNSGELECGGNGARMYNKSTGIYHCSTSGVGPASPRDDSVARSVAEMVRKRSVPVYNNGGNVITAGKVIDGAYGLQLKSAF